MKTSFPKPSAEVTWYVLDAAGETLGRLSSRIAVVLRGRHRARFVPHWPTGDHVIVLNAEKVKVSGNKLEDKEYYKHTGYFGNMKSATMREILEKNPTKVLTLAVKGMLPKNASRDRILRNLHVIAGSEHKYASRKPVPFPR